MSDPRLALGRWGAGALAGSYVGVSVLSLFDD